jgi:hypothetical protein
MGDFLDESVKEPTIQELRKVRSVINILRLRAKDGQFRNEVMGYLECLAEEMQIKLDKDS